MRQIYDNTGVVLLAWLLCFGCSAEPELAALPEDAVILAFGDSLTFGKGASAERSYPAVLSSLIGRKVIRAGISGEITEQGLARLPAVLAEHAPDLVIICHGGNDILRRVPSARTRANLERMVELVRDAGADALLVAVPSRSLSLTPPPFYEDIAQAYGVVLEGEIVREVLRSSELKSDSVHPNSAGYRLIADRLAALLRERGALAI